MSDKGSTFESGIEGESQSGGERPPPTRCGRYVLIEKLGQGAMGVVYRAFDPLLDRQVALKLVQGGHGQNQGSAGRGRLVREAKAMARLSHANVVSVFDAGVAGDDVFIAMELLDGQTLYDWQKERHHWREILDIYIKAGQGLAAAHRGELVHRDFKPDNVIISSDGRVRVLDFGLAVAPRGKAVDEEAKEGAPRPLGRGVRLERFTIGVVGTPWYMAPEQAAGLEADARTDQYCFSVALYEALYGEHPVHGAVASDDGQATRPLQSPAEEQAMELEVRPAPAGARVPGWLRGVLLRGLAADPEARFPSMDALLVALAADPAAHRWRLFAGGALACLVLGTVSAIWQAKRTERERCRAALAPMGQLWSESRRQRLGSVFHGSSVANGDEIWSYAAGIFDRYAQDWNKMRGEVCEATHIRHEASPEELELRMDCLDGRLEAMRAQLGVFETPDEDAVHRAVAAATELPRLETCADVSQLKARVPLPAGAKLQVQKVREALARVNAVHTLLHPDQAIARSRDVLGQARALHYPPVEAEALEMTGSIIDSFGRFVEATPLLTEATLVGERAGDDLLVARASAELAMITGYRLGRIEEGRLWLARAEAKLGRLGTVNDYAEFMVAQAISMYGSMEGDKAKSLAAVQNELAVARRLHDERAVAKALGNVGNAYAELGRLPEALVYGRDSVATYERLYGDLHPELPWAINNYASTALDMGNRALAVPLFERAIALQSRLGPSHWVISLAESNLGQAALEEHHFDEARRHFERGVKLMEEVSGPNSPLLVTQFEGLVRLELLVDQPERVAPLVERLLRLAANRGDRSERAWPHFQLARARWAMGEREAALALAREALAELPPELERKRELRREIIAWLPEEGSAAAPAPAAKEKRKPPQGGAKGDRLRRR